MPFAVVGSNQIIEVKGRKVRGRMYPWGVVEVENPDHCDFIKLRTMLMLVYYHILVGITWLGTLELMGIKWIYLIFRTHMQDLQEVTHELHYENFRSERLSGTE